MQEKNKLLALAKLKVGVKPKQVAEDCEISYGQALQLKKDLELAEEKNAVLELINMEEAVFEELIETVKNSLQSSSSTLGLPDDILEGELERFDKAISATSLLQNELTDAAYQLANKIKQQAILTQNSDSLLILAEALSKLNTSFFAKGTNVQINQMGNNFETYLQD